MRKKFLSVMSVVLVATFASASLTGCGTEAKATDQEVVMDEEPIIVTEEETSEEVTIETEDEITEEEEVIAETEEEAEAEASYTEHEYFFALDELDLSETEEIDWDAMTLDHSGNYDLHNSVDIYGSKGAVIGYTKPDITVEVMHSSDDWTEFYFENEEDKYKYVVAKTSDFIASSGIYENMPAVTADDVKLVLMNQLYNAYDGIDEVYYVALEDTTEEMNLSAEFTVPTYCRDLDEAIAPIVADNDFGNYKYFHFEKVEEKSDEENSCFKVTYGASQEFAE